MLVNILYYIIITILLNFVIYQDFRYQKLSVLILVQLCLVAFSYSIYRNGWKMTLSYLGINILIILIQLIFITIYYSVKNKKIHNFINTSLGSGDLFFFLILALTFSPLNLIAFNIISCLLVLIIYAIFNFSINKIETIPLAGCQAIGLILFFICNYFFLGISQFDDFELMSKLIFR